MIEPRRQLRQCATGGHHRLRKKVFGISIDRLIDLATKLTRCVSRPIVRQQGSWNLRVVQRDATKPMDKQGSHHERLGRCKSRGALHIGERSESLREGAITVCEAVEIPGLIDESPQRQCRQYVDWSCRQNKARLDMSSPSSSSRNEASSGEGWPNTFGASLPNPSHSNSRSRRSRSGAGFWLTGA
jgi:hypothetical protein